MRVFVFDRGLTHCLKIVEDDDSDFDGFFDAGERWLVLFRIEVLAPTSFDLGIIIRVYG